MGAGGDTVQPTDDDKSREAMLEAATIVAVGWIVSALVAKENSGVTTAKDAVESARSLKRALLKA